MTVLHSFGGAWYCVNANDSTIVSLAKGPMARAGAFLNRGQTPVDKSLTPSSIFVGADLSTGV
jgi:hypothetical protein